MGNPKHLQGFFFQEGGREEGREGEEEDDLRESLRKHSVI